MNRRACLAAIVLLLLVGLSSAPAQAICKNPRLIEFESSVYTPGFPPGTGYLGSTVSPDFQGGFWALGAGDPALEAGADSGAFEALQDGWIDAQPGYPAGGVRPGVSRTWAGSPEIDGCVDDVEGDRCMALLFMDQNATSGYFWLGTDAPDTLANYDLTVGETLDMAAIPAPVLLDIPPFGEVFQGPFAFDVAAVVDLDPDCAQDVVVGFKVYRHFGAGRPTDFTRDNGVPGSGWELHPDGVGPGGAPLPLDSIISPEPFCPIGGAVYYAYSLVFDSGFETAYLSAPSEVLGCDCGDGEDADGDGFCGVEGSSLTDCDDADALVYPGAPEVCDGLNDDCLDPGWPAVPADEADADDDGFSICEDDCNDGNPSVHPAAPQICDGLNNDCDAPGWPNPPTEDADADGDGTAPCGGDCDEGNNTVYPGAPQICDDTNNDCDHPDWPLLTGTTEVDLDGDGFSFCTGDCDDDRDTVYPLAPPICDGLNNNCFDPLWPEQDDSDPTDIDMDGDLQPVCAGDCDDENATVFAGAPDICGDDLNNNCLDPNWPIPPQDTVDMDGDGLSICDGDCSDSNAAVFPGAPDACDGLNNDCLDPSWPTVSTDELDRDGDGQAVCAGDCDDSSAAVFAGAPDTCDGLNNDCLDPGWPVPPEEEIDTDGDGQAGCAGDCDDSSAAVFAGAPDICDGLNNNCLDPNWPDPRDEEIDGDGDGLSICNGDCDDADPAVRPGSVDVCDGIDNDCDGDVDEGVREDCDNGLDDDCDGLIDEADIVDCDTLSVSLESFTARYTRGSVLIQWTTSAEIDNVGFRILRQRQGGKLLSITSQVIPAVGTEVSGATYRFVDEAGQLPGRVFYYLEDVDWQGRTTRHGPIVVQIPYDRKETRP